MAQAQQTARTPPFTRWSARVQEAYRFAREAHEGPRRRGDTTIAHPAAVAQLLAEAGYPEHVVVAALLHDVVEDTATGIEELRRRFGPEASALVAQLTEDDGIDSYDERKGELRRRAITDGDDAAAVFSADKLASLRHLNAEAQSAPPEKLEHYEQSVRLLRRRHPDLPFLDALAEELARLRARA
jgi:(p)ppGpp synthase/HD superfamily hydrolase